MLDVDGALKFLALEVALVNSDGYWTRASDYSIYQDDEGTFHVIPHDVNEGLADEGGRGFGPPPGFGPGGPGGPGRGGRPRPGRAAPPDGMFGPVRAGGRGMFGGATADLDPLVGLDDASKPLRSKLLAVPALREQYLSYVREIAQKHLDWKRSAAVQQYQALIAADVKADTRKLYSFERSRPVPTARSEASRRLWKEERSGFVRFVSFQLLSLQLSAFKSRRRLRSSSRDLPSRV